MMDAAEAERSGLVAAWYPPDKLMDEASAAAETIAAMSHPAADDGQEAINRAFETPLSEGLNVERDLFHPTVRPGGPLRRHGGIHREAETGEQEQVGPSSPRNGFAVIVEVRSSSIREDDFTQVTILRDAAEPVIGPRFARTRWRLLRYQAATDRAAFSSLPPPLRWGGWRAEGPSGGGWLRKYDGSGRNSIPPPHLSGGFQPPDFRLELKAQLRGFLVGQPVRHLRKDGPVKQDGLRLPWQPLAPRGLQPEFVEFGAHRIRIGPVFWRGRTAQGRMSSSEFASRAINWLRIASEITKALVSPVFIPLTGELMSPKRFTAALSSLSLSFQRSQTSKCHRDRFKRSEGNEKYLSTKTLPKSPLPSSE